MFNHATIAIRGYPDIKATIYPVPLSPSTTNDLHGANDLPYAPLEKERNR